MSAVVSPLRGSVLFAPYPGLTAWANSYRASGASSSLFLDRVYIKHIIIV